MTPTPEISRMEPVTEESYERSAAAPRRTQKICVIMPAYNAEKTLERTWRALPTADGGGEAPGRPRRGRPMDYVDDIIVVDDASSDRTVEVARGLGLHVIVHPRNRGYGGNQKTCYREALARGADIVVMVHPDHQYAPSHIPALVGPLRRGPRRAAG